MVLIRFIDEASGFQKYNVFDCRNKVLSNFRITHLDWFGILAYGNKNVSRSR